MDYYEIGPDKYLKKCETCYNTFCSECGDFKCTLARSKCKWCLKNIAFDDTDSNDDN